MLGLLLISAQSSAQQNAPQSQASGSPQQRAQQALDIGDLESALSIYQSRAFAGEIWAQIILAQINQNGRLVERSIANAVDWYARAAAAGSVEAQFQLGLIFCDENDQNNNRPAKCIDWLQRAAANNHAGAAYQMAMMAYQGRYFESDLNSTRTLASQAAAAGITEAQTLVTQIDEDLKFLDKHVTVLSSEIIAAEYNSQKYTVRLAIFNSQSQLRRFALQSSLNKLYAYPAGSVWVLSHGSFTSEKKALAAIPSLDQSIRNLDPQALSWSQVLTNLQGNG